MATESEQQNESPDPHETFLRLWMQHEPELRAFVRSCCPKAQEVDDVMQEVSVAALRKFSTLDDHSAFGPWACLIARYELLAARRRFARDRLVLAEDIVELLADEGAEELPLRQRQLRALDQCIEKLPRERRELALAAYAKGHNDSRVGRTAQTDRRLAVSTPCTYPQGVASLHGTDARWS